MLDNLSLVLFPKYVNPVFPQSFPDPFVLKFGGEYFAYCTGFWEDGRVFGVLHSRNLVDWTEIGGAMKPLENDAPYYWAPEVTYSNGKFYLFYSVGNETLMELRVAVSDRPEGVFVDSGKKLTTEQFAIDAHVFTDETGEKYLFYATDFLEHTHIGTGTVVDKMLDFFTLEGKPRPVTRAKYDWQVYDPARQEKGGVRWHTVEGSFVLKRKGIYYQMFSGGNWQNVTYGVSFAITDNLTKDEEWIQYSDGEKILPILRTLPGLVVGPGHNSVIRGVNNRELFCIYHRWADESRVLAIDRMDFAGTRMFVEGASFTEQLAPLEPNFVDFFDGQTLNKNWDQGGDWETSGGEVFNKSTDRSILICHQKATSFLSEFTFRALQVTDETGGYGFCLIDDEEETFEFRLFPYLREASAVWFENDEYKTQTFSLPADFDFEAIHLLRVEVDGLSLKIKLDETAFIFEKLTGKVSRQIALVAENMQAAFSWFALTKGFEDLFEWDDLEIERHNWEQFGETGEILVENQQLICSNQAKNETIVVKGKAAEDFEFRVNLRLLETFGENYAFGFAFLDQDGHPVSRFSILEKDGVFFLSNGNNSFDEVLPATYSSRNFHQFCLFKKGEKILWKLEGLELGEISKKDGRMRVGLFFQNAEIALEMVRLTIL